MASRMIKHRTQYRIKKIIFCLCLCFISEQTAVAGGWTQVSQQTGSSSNGDSNSRTTKEGSVYLLIALLAGTLMIPFKKSSQEKLGERRKDRFYQRFTSRQRAMTKDLRRRKGKHYRWLVHDFLSISPLHRKSFRCLLRLEKKQANQLLKQAQSKRRSDVDMLASWLTSLASRASTKRHNCALLFHYLKDPASFERSILEKYNNESTFFLLNYIDLQKTHKREFLCHLRSDQTSLIQAFNLMKKRKQRDRGVDQLDRTLKSARARTLNRAIRCGP